MPLEWPKSRYPTYTGGAAGQLGQIWYDDASTVTSVTSPYTIYSSGQTALANTAQYTFSTYQTSVTVGTSATWYAWQNAQVGFYQQAQWAQWQGGIVSAKTKRQAAAEQARFDRQQAEARRLMEEQRAKIFEAQKRARALLMTSLSPAQRESLEKFRFFDIEISGKTYRIHQGTHGNVRQVENGREIITFCAQPEGVPTEDAMLAQKLMLETDEAAFLRVANARRL